MILKNLKASAGIYILDPTGTTSVLKDVESDRTYAVMAAGLKKVKLLIFDFNEQNQSFEPYKVWLEERLFSKQIWKLVNEEDLKGMIRKIFR